MARMQRSYKSIRSLQLFIGSFNVAHRYVIFTIKLFSIVVGIISGFAAIAQFQDHPIFGVMYYVLFADVFLI